MIHLIAAFTGCLVSSVFAFWAGRLGLKKAQADAKSYREEYHDRCARLVDARREIGELKAECENYLRSRNNAFVALESLSAECDRLRNRLVKFNHTIHPTPQEIAREELQAAREKCEAARRKFQDLRGEK